MLVLTRKPGGRIFVGDDIEVTVLRIDGNKVRLGFKAPRDVEIVRDDAIDRGRSDKDPAVVTS